MKRSVIIPTWRRAALLAETLDSLAKQTEHDFEVIVVSDGEDAETRTLAAQYEAAFPLRWIFSAENRGRSMTRNEGARAANSELLLFLDDDTPADPEWVACHSLRHSNQDGAEAMAVCGRIVETYSEAPKSKTEAFLRAMRDKQLERIEEAYSRRGTDVVSHACFGVNCSISREGFRAAGGFDPKHRYPGEDYELGTRMFNAGVRFEYEPRAIVRHRSTRHLVPYYKEMLPEIGRSDLRRVREGSQRNAQTGRIAALHAGPVGRRLTYRLAWHFPKAFRAGAALCERATDAAGWKGFFRIWQALSIGRYWEGIKSEGETASSLRKFTPPPAPALMFHSISIPETRMQRFFAISPRKFSGILAWMKRAHRQAVLPLEWLRLSLPKSAVMLTFDDGYEDFYNEAFPVLKRFGFNATLFVVVDRLGETNTWDRAEGHPSRPLLSLAQVRELHAAGIHIGSHSLTHRSLTRLSTAELEREVKDSKSKLEDMLGSEVPCFAYPYGDADARVRAAVARAGYKVAMTTNEGLNCFDDPLALRRINVGEIDGLLEFLIKLRTGKDLRRRAGDWLRRGR